MKKWLKRVCALALAAGLLCCCAVPVGAANYSLPPAKMTVVYGGTRYAHVAYKSVDDYSGSGYAVYSPGLSTRFVEVDDSYWGDGHAPDYQNVYFCVEGNHLGKYTIEYYDGSTLLGSTEVECVLGGPLQWFAYYVLFGWAWMDNPDIKDTGKIRTGGMTNGINATLVYLLTWLPHVLWYGRAEQSM